MFSSGAILGVICGVSASLGVASTYEGGLSNFLENTVQNHSVIAGAGTSIGTPITYLFLYFVLIEICWYDLNDAPSQHIISFNYRGFPGEPIVAHSKLNMLTGCCQIHTFDDMPCIL